MKDLILITGCTEEKGLMSTYLKQLSKADIEVHVEKIENFDAVNNIGGQVAAQRKLAEKFRDYRKLVFTDGFDVMFYGEKSEVLSKIPDDRVLMAAERNCWPDPTLANGMPGTTPWRFVNGGMIAGTPTNILRWLWMIESHHLYHPKMCNQAFFNLLKFKGDPIVSLDETTELFYCLYHEKQELDFVVGLPVNTVLGTHPNFIHANGQWPIAPVLKRRARSLGEPEPKGPVMSVPDTKMLSSVGLQIGLPFCGRPVSPNWAVTLATQNYPLNTNRVIHATSGKEIGEARNYIAETALKGHAKYLWFLDDDVSVPPHAAKALIGTLENADSKTMVAAGIYTSKYDPAEPVVFRGEGMGPFWKWKVGDVFEVSSIGTGCMMIKTEVFEHLEKPWFKTVDELADGNGKSSMQMTDDMYFCFKVKEAGFKILADANVLTTHWGYDYESRVFTPHILAEDCYPMRPVSEDEPRCERRMI